MSRETKYTAIILKKQPFNEADEIITFFTKEQGKVRCLAKSVKMSKSKLQQKLQALFLVELTVTLGKMPKIMSVEPVKAFANIRENLSAMKMAFYALELVLKFTADEQKNEQLFNLFLEFLEFLNSNQPEHILDLGLAKFKILMLEFSGLGIDYFPEIVESDQIYFSNDRGGFSDSNFPGTAPVFKQVFELFLTLIKTSFNNLSSIFETQRIGDLQNLLSQFIEYQLERKIKSEKFLSQ